MGVFLLSVLFGSHIVVWDRSSLGQRSRAIASLLCNVVGDWVLDVDAEWKTVLYGIQ